MGHGTILWMVNANAGKLIRIRKLLNLCLHKTATLLCENAYKLLIILNKFVF